MGLRILFLLLVIWAIAMIVRTLMRSNKTRQAPPDANPAQQKLLKCEFCGVHCPEETAFRYQEHSFCSKEHLDHYFQYTDDKPD